MNGLNKAYLIGNLGRDPELRSTAAGLSVVKLSLATPHGRKVNDEWVSTPDWHRVTAFGKEAEYLARAAHKGDGLAVECAIRPRKWTDKEGKTRYEIDLVVERVLWVAARRRSDTPPSAPTESDEGPPPDDEVPF